MSIARHHAEWLSLVEHSGPFLSLPVLLASFRTGLEAHDPERFRELRLAYEEWEEKWDDPAIHHAWIKFVLRDLLELTEEVLAEGQAIAQSLTVTIAEHGETLRPDLVVHEPRGGKARMLIQTYPPTQELEKPVSGRLWKASPSTRMMELLHGTGVRLGLVTNGRQWMLVNAPRGETTGFASWYAEYWIAEPITLRAFRSLLGCDRFFNVPDDQTLEAMLAQSAENQQEVTDQLGLQVRNAVEILIQALDRADQDHGRELLADVPESVLYEAALTVMMRLVFLFCAEERRLLPDDEFYVTNYSVSSLGRQLRETSDEHGEEILERRHDAWCRLLAAFRVVHGGVSHDRFNLPAYGGHLFDPDRFAFLEGRRPGTSWRNTPADPLPVDNRTVLHLLEALQLLEMRIPGGAAEKRRLSFLALDIEQIGHVYESLLDHTARRASEPVLGLMGTKSKEPEIPLSRLEAEREKGDDQLLAFLKKQTGRSVSALRNSLDVKLDRVEANRLQAACGGDQELWNRIKPFARLIRNDTFGRPVIIRAGSVYVTTGTDRRTTGTHYTPRCLTEPIVQHTLEPLVYEGPAEGKPPEQWKLRPAAELLELNICDMACGSGAFLVQACRYLSERLVEAWQLAEEQYGGSPRITPEGQPAGGKPGERLIPKDADERIVYARRIVAARCLYGVDKNPLAVEMAKLSLWLLTLAKDKPFTFLDHAIRCGDSLVGVGRIEQLLRFSLEDGETQFEFAHEQIKRRLEAARLVRRQLEELSDSTVHDTEQKALMLARAQEQTRRLTYAADRLIAAYWEPMSRTERQRHLRHSLRDVELKFKDLPVEQLDREAQAQLQQIGCPKPFHWPLEFPEVFDRGGFDALVCNPPFMGGQKITGHFGTGYRDYLVQSIANGKKGSADLCAYFFLRAASILRPYGNLGMLATNTIGQGDTREVGLDQLTSDELTVFRASPSQVWPGNAAVFVAVCHLHKGQWKGSWVLDDVQVQRISSYLDSEERIGQPRRLAANANLSYKGTEVYGLGFVLSPDEARSLCLQDPRNGDVVAPYLDGEAVNKAPDQSAERWVIDFTGMSESQAATYPDCFRILEERVKPQRLALASRNSSGRGRAKLWWRFSREVKELYDAIRGRQRVLVIARVSRTGAFVYVTPQQVLNEKLIVFTICDTWAFALLQSSIHLEWCWTYASTLKGDLNYSQTDCFETFPLPDGKDALNSVGDIYHEHRRQIMLDRQEGLTKTYNRFHNPEVAGTGWQVAGRSWQEAFDSRCRQIEEQSSAPQYYKSDQAIDDLRALHILMDLAVALAYGWPVILGGHVLRPQRSAEKQAGAEYEPLHLGHGFHQTRQGLRFTISDPARREVLQRLLKLNHQRYEEEVRRGLHEKKRGGKRTAARKKQRRKKQPPTGATLFDADDDSDGTYNR